MRKTLILALVAATALTLSATSWGAKPTPAATLTIAIAPNPVTFATKSTISGTISSKAAGVQLILEVLPYPYTGKYTDTGTATTAADGSYLFTVTPPTSTRYRVTSVDKPKITSPEATLAIKWRVGLKVSDWTPTKGKLVKFSGTVKPSHANGVVFIQRLTKSGWKNVKQALLATSTLSSSSYSTRVKVLNTGKYRAAVLGDGAHETGISRVRKLTVG